jgi:hypothetical protein
VKRKAKQSGSGGRLRWGLLLATVAAFLLVPAASAFAGVQGEVIGAGEGSGWVKGVGTAEEQGNPPVDCHWSGELQEFDTAIPLGSGKCKFEAINIGIGEGAVELEGEHDPGSLLYGWHVVEGSAVSGCEEPVFSQEEICGVLQFAPSPAGIKVRATFNLQSEPLTLTASGAAGGGFECEINGGAKGACPTEAPVGKNVKVYPTGTGVELEEWTTGPCESTSDNPCEFTMPEEPVSANAAFAVASESYAVTAAGGGTGTLVCKVEGSPASCSGSALYGETIHVAAAPDAENVVEKIDTTGSAACSVAFEGVSGECSFVIHASSTATVYFESAGTKAVLTPPATVEGEVPITTSLEGCESPVVLGPFVPTVVENYEGTCSVTATSTGVETELSAEDKSAEETGHLVQEYEDKNHVVHHYRLPSALETRANGLAGLEFPGTGHSYAPLTSKVDLLDYAGPVSADNVTVHFKQHIGLHDALHTGTYAKTITLTLEQTTP